MRGVAPEVWVDGKLRRVRRVLNECLIDRNHAAHPTGEMTAAISTNHTNFCIQGLGIVIGWSEIIPPMSVPPS